MKERRDAGKDVLYAGKEVFRKGRVQERGVQERRGAGKEGRRQGGIQEVRDAGNNFILYRHCFVQQS